MVDSFSELVATLESMLGDVHTVLSDQIEAQRGPRLVNGKPLRSAAQGPTMVSARIFPTEPKGPLGDLRNAQ